MKDFQTLGLPSQLLASIDAMGFKEPTPIQSQAIPVALQGKDLIGCAQTGTGKTAAFSIPMLTKLEEQAGKMALILAPTRELARQIEDVIYDLTANSHHMTTALLIGGAPMGPQMRVLAKKPRIIVATPGRLIDHLQRRTIALDQVSLLILDEADRMLDMGFAPQLEEILQTVPKNRQTLLFSATLPLNIERLAKKYMTDPVRVNAGAVSQPVSRIKQSVIPTTNANKNTVLMSELDVREGSVLIFARTKHRTDRLARYLNDQGYAVARIHGDRTQRQRDAAIHGFREGSFRILVATDVASRGLDIPHIAHVINYDLPQTPEDYTHRIGRTARAGALGEALCLLAPEEQHLWKRISRLKKV